MALKQKEAVELIKETLWPAFKKERDRLDRIDAWYRWDHDKPHAPKISSREYQTLMDSAKTPWLGLVVTSLAQALYVDGYRQKGSRENAAPWRWWQANGMDARQIAIHRAALAYGYAFETVLPGIGEFGDRMPVMRGISPRRMVAFYREPEHDDWPHYALRADPAKVNGAMGWSLRLYDDENVYYLNADAGAGTVTWMESRVHGLGLCPVVRFANMLDLEGRTPGEVEPFIPIAQRINQTTFNRQVVERFASWVVRTVSGMAKPDTDEEAAAKKLKLWIDDVLVAEDPDTKFGSLPATSPDGFTNTIESEIKVLAAVSQTPAHEMLGTIANLSAEALEAARSSKSDKVDERKLPFGESHEQSFRLAAHIMGDDEAKQDVEAEVKWRETKIRSLAQAADALGKLTTMLSIPAEVLLEKIPGWTQAEVEEVKRLWKENPPEPPKSLEQ